MCSSIGITQSNKFSICSNVKILFGCPKIQANYSLIIMYSNIGTPKIINFPFGINGKLMVLGVPIFKHFRVLENNPDNFLFSPQTLCDPSLNCLV